MSFEFYWSGSLHPPGEALSALESGLVDISFVAASSFPAELPVANWFGDVGAMHQSDAWPLQQMQSLPAMVEQYETNEDLQAEFTEAGLVPLAQFASTSFDILCSTPVEAVAHARGKLVRTPGDPWLGEAESLGMSHVNIPYGEMYEGMQRGVFDCSVSTPAGFLTTGLADVANYYTPVGMSTTAKGLILMNKDVWEGLPTDVQDIIRDANSTFGLTFMEANLDRYRVWAEESAANGIQFLDGTALREAINDHQSEMSEALVENAPATVSDPQGAIDGYRDSLEEWLKASEEDFGIPAEPLSGGEIVDSYMAVKDLDWSAYSKRIKERLESSK